MDKQYLKELLGHDRLDEVFQFLFDLGKNREEKEFQNALSIQFNRFQQYRQHQMNRTLSEGDLSIMKNQILSALLSLVDHFPEVDKAEKTIPGHSSKSVAERKKKKTFPVGWIGGAVLLALSLFLGNSLFYRWKTNGEPIEIPAGKIEGSGKKANGPLLVFPESDMVTFRSSTGQEIGYKLLEGRVENSGGNVRNILLTIRCLPKNGYDVNFWDDTFRLELDDPEALLAPVSGLNEVVPDNSFKDGQIIFEVKQAVSIMKIVLINPFDESDFRKLSLQVATN